MRPRVVRHQRRRHARDGRELLVQVDHPPRDQSGGREFEEATLLSLTGFLRVPLEGFEDAGAFFGMLARGEFPIGYFTRDRGDLGYTPAPDVFHDLYDHLPFLAEKFPVGRRIFGAGIASSFTECAYALSDQPEVLPFNVSRILDQPFRIDQLQSRLFLLKSGGSFTTAWKRSNGRSDQRSRSGSSPRRIRSARYSVSLARIAALRAISRSRIWLRYVTYPTAWPPAVRTSCRSRSRSDLAD